MYSVSISGRSAAWLARLVRDQEAGGSNPLAPTIPILQLQEIFFAPAGLRRRKFIHDSWPVCCGRLSFVFAGHVPQGLDDSAGIFLGHAGINRKRNRPFEAFLGNWKFASAESKQFAVKRMQMERNEVHGRSN